MELADAPNNDPTPGDAFHRASAEDGGGGIAAPEMVGADGEEGNETQHGCHGPSGDHKGGKTDVGQKKDSRLCGPPHPAKVNGQCTVHGTVRQTNEHHAKKSDQVQRFQSQKGLKECHETTLRGRRNIIFETPRIKGNFGMAIMTLKRSLHPARPLIKRMNSSPDRDCAMRPNRMGP